MTESWSVGSEDEGSRLDRAVASRLGVARNQVQQWIREGRVEVSGVPERASFRLSEGDEIRCDARVKETAVDVIPEPKELDLLYEDAEIVVVDKQPGVAVHPGAGRRSGTLVNHLIAAYPELGEVGGADRPGIVHRLDIDTTGVLVVARSEEAYQRLSRAFAAREVDKTYLGVVFGQPAEAEGVIDLPIGRHPRRRKEMAVRPGGRPASTGYRTIGHADGVSLLVFQLHSGRTHQIRVHLKALGHPLVGDALYAGNRWRGAPPQVRRVLASFPRPALHARRLAFDHPGSGRRVSFEAAVPGDLVDLWKSVGGGPFPAD